MMRIFDIIIANWRRWLAVSLAAISAIALSSCNPNLLKSQAADGNRVRFTMLASAGSRTGDAISSQIKRDLSKIGIQVDFQPLSFNVLEHLRTQSCRQVATIIPKFIRGCS